MIQAKQSYRNYHSMIIATGNTNLITIPIILITILTQKKLVFCYFWPFEQIKVQLSFIVAAEDVYTAGRNFHCRTGSMPLSL